jgi:hypothetical protein
VRIYFDENLSNAIAGILREGGVGFRGDVFQAIADAISGVLKRYPAGLHGLVIYIGRQ